MQQQQQQQPEQVAAKRAVPFKVFFSTLKKQKLSLAVTGYALFCLANASGQLSVKKERQRLDEVYGERIAELEAQNASMRSKIAAVEERVLSEASSTGRLLAPLERRMNTVFDELCPPDAPAAAAATEASLDLRKPEQNPAKATFLV